MKKTDYHSYIRSHKWRDRHSQWLKQSNYRCAAMPWVKVGRGHRYRVHHMIYDNLGNERLYRDVVVLCPFFHDQIIHGILSGWKSAGQQKNYPNLAQRIAHVWCWLPVLGKLGLTGVAIATALKFYQVGAISPEIVQRSLGSADHEGFLLRNQSLSVPPSETELP